MNNIIKNIYELHMNISFDNKHIIYKHISKQCKNNHIIFDNNIVIPINGYNRYDYGLHIIKNFYLYGKLLLVDRTHMYNKKMLDIMTQLSKDDLNMIMINDKCDFSDELYSKIHKLNYIYNKKIQSGDFNIIILWIYKKYLLLNKWYISNKKFLDTETIISLYYFLGTIEWVHIYILILLLNNHKKRIVIGENLLFDCNDLQTLTSTKLNDYFNNEYTSHTVIYMMNNINISLYDPDYVKDDTDDKIKILEKFLELKYIPLCISTSIQEKTDDNYCIFHCIRIISYILKLNINFNQKGFNILRQYINNINITTDKSVIIDYINRIDNNLKYRLSPI